MWCSINFFRFSFEIDFGQYQYFFSAFQLQPASLTKFSARDQLMAHEERVTLLEQEMIDHRANPPPAKAKSTAIATYREKDAYLHFEVSFLLYKIKS